MLFFDFDSGTKKRKFRGLANNPPRYSRTITESGYECCLEFCIRKPNEIMKKFITTLALAAAISVPAFAQQTTTKKVVDRGSNIEATAEDYGNIIDSRIYVDTRAQAIRTLGLGEKQMELFTPIYLDYTRAKEALEERRMDLVREYREEMAEDDTISDEENETADFIENYWELDIDYMEMKKDFFDRFEDAITSRKALDFFAMEDMFNARANRKLVMELLPTYKILVPVSISYQDELDDYRNWNSVNIEGKVGLDHNYTYNGLTKLLTVAEKMAITEGVSINDFAERKQMIMDKAEMMKKDWKSLNHADLAREAFTMTADLLKDVATDSRFTADEADISKLRTVAESVKPAVKLTDQASTVYRFFDVSEDIVNGLVKQANNMK